MSPAELVNLPFPRDISPDAERAGAHMVDWLRGHGLLDDEGTGAYPTHRLLRCEPTRMAAEGWPYALGADLDLAADWMGLLMVFDDPFDGALGRNPAACLALAGELISAVGGGPAPGTGATAAFARAFADLWHRTCEGMSPTWRGRALCHYERWLTAYAHEARGRVRGTPWRMDYMVLRRGSGAMDLVMDLVERLGHCELPPGARYGPELMVMRRIAIDLAILVNEITSLAKEELIDGVNNAVLHGQHQRGCTREEAVAAVLGEMREQSEQFTMLAADIPGMCRSLGLSGRERAHVQRYVEGIRLFLGGCLHWSSTTWRYGQECARTQDLGYASQATGSRCNP